MKKLFFLIIVAANTSLFATYLPFSYSNFIIRPSDARGISMGLTGTSFSSGITSLCSNPAGLSFSGNSEFIYSHFPSIKLNNGNVYNKETVGLCLPIFKHYSFGFLYSFVYGDKYSVTNAVGQIISSKRSNTANALISASRIFKFNNDDVFSIGLSFKRFEDRLPGEEKRNAFRLDFGLRYKSYFEKGNWYSIGLSINDIGQDLKYNNYFTEKSLQIMRAGLAYCFNDFKNKNFAVLTCIEYQQSFSKEKHFTWEILSLGFEMQLFDNFFGRFGYIFDYNDNDKNHSNEYRGLTYGLSFITDKTIHIIYPFYVSLSYGKGLSDYRKLDCNIISLKLIFKK